MHEPEHILNRPLPIPSQPELTPDDIANLKKQKKVTAVKNVSQQLQNEFIRATEHTKTIKSQVEESNSSAEALLAQIKTRKEDGDVRTEKKKKKKKKSEDTIEQQVLTTSPIAKATSEVVDPWGDGPIILDKKGLQVLGLSSPAWSAMQGLVPHGEIDGVPSLDLETTFICFNCGLDAVSRKTKLMKCKRCMIAAYCGKDCQKLNWLKHKKVCKCVGIRRQHGENEPLKILL